MDIRYSYKGNKRILSTHLRGLRLSGRCVPLKEMKKLKHIKFQNKKRPRFDFDLLKLEELLSRRIEHDITQTHKIAFFHILLVTHGQGYHTIDFTDYKYKKGTLLTIRKDQMHRFFRSSNTKGYLLLFTEDFLVSHFGKTEVLRAFHLFNELLTSPKIELDKKDFMEVLMLVESIEAEYNEHNDEFSMAIVRSAMHMLIAKLFRIKSKNENKLHKRKYLDEFLQFQKLIEENCFKTRKAIDYAKMMHCTTKTLNNVSRAILDKSAKVLIDDIVVSQIKRLLINTQLSITEIAYAAGFEEPTNLYRYFKKRTNHSPETFRKANS